MGLAVSWHIRASWSRDQTCVPCSGAWILHHWGTREALSVYFFFLIFILCIYLAVLSLHCSTRNQSLLQCAISQLQQCGSSSPARDETQSPALSAWRNLATGPPGTSQFQCILSCAPITPHLVSDDFHPPNRAENHLELSPPGADNHHLATSCLCRLIHPGHFTEMASNDSQPLVSPNNMVGWHHRLSGHEFEQTAGVGNGQGGLACCSPWGPKESDTTDRLT